MVNLTESPHFLLIKKSSAIAAIALLVFLGLSIDLDQESNYNRSFRRDLSHTDRFLLRGNDLENATAREPYYAKVDDDSGEILEAITHGDPNHPLSRLGDLRPPYLDDFDSAISRERKAATAFFFMLPEVCTAESERPMWPCCS